MMKDLTTKDLILPEARWTRRVTYGFSLVELLVVIGIVALLLSILLPVLSGVRASGLRLRCMNNLRQIGLAMTIYSSREPDGGFPRTTYKLGQHLQLDNAGYLVPNSFGKSGYVGENNVPASLFLLLKVEKLPASMFVCPSTDATAGFTQENPQLSSNWGFIPQNMNYSFATAFPETLGVQQGFKWNLTINSQFALAADMNPGTRGGVNPPNNVVAPPHDASDQQMAAANSNNHLNKGQNVLYGDGHVEWQTTPYCGVMRAVGFPDQIYTAGNGDGGITSDIAFPVDSKDSVLLPTDDPGGK
jgi:prepilin-type N-terminal cleavage/methylation domain-containing protein/prepilin-type processing-associated H-X9-DG protein